MGNPKNYIGVVFVKAGPQSYGAFRKTRGGQYGDGQVANPHLEGYRVQYPHGLTDWISKREFDMYYKELSGKEKSLINSENEEWIQ